MPRRLPGDSLCTAPDSTRPSRFSTRIMLVAALVALLLLAACSAVPVPDSPLPEGVVRGQVTFEDLRPLPAGATIEVQIIDTSISGFPANVFASTTLQAGGLRPPVSYQLTFDPAAVKPGVQYLIGAQVRSGNGILYVSQGGQQILGDGMARDRVELAASALPIQPAVPGELNGTLTWLTRDLLPNNATVAVQLVDRTTQPYTRIAETAFRSEGAQSPIPFLLQYDPAVIDPTRTYALEARISEEGRLGWLSDAPVPALTQDAPGDAIEIPMRRVASATVASAGNSVVANLVFPGAEPLPLGSTAQVEIRDLAQNAVVATVSLDATGALSPLGVEIPLDFTPSELRDYVLTARIESLGQTLYLDESEVAVLTRGAPVTNIAVPLIAAQAPVVFATSVSTPIPIPTAIAVTGSEPAPSFAPAFPGEDDAGELILSGTITGTVALDDALDPPVNSVIEVVLEMLFDGEGVAVSQSAVDSADDEPSFAFTLDYEPSIIDSTIEYQVLARLLDDDGEVVAVAEPVSVLTLENPFGDVELTILALPADDEAAEAGASEEDAEEEEETEEEATETPTPEGEVTEEPTAAPTATSVATAEPIDLSQEGVVAVRVTFGAPDAIEPGTEVRVELRDVGMGAILADATVDATDPAALQAIRLDYNPGSVNEIGDYRVFVTVLLDGSPIGFTGRGTPVISGGAPRSVEIVLP